MKRLLTLAILIVAVTVLAPAASASRNVTAVSVGAQTTPPVAQGGTATYTNFSTTWGGFTGTCTPVVTFNWTGGQPAGVTTSFNPTPLTSSNNVPDLDIATTSATPPGTYTFTVTVNSTSGSGSCGTGNFTSASATLAVEAPPTISKSFAPAAIAAGGTSTLTITLSAPSGNPASLTGVADTDTMPTGVTISGTTTNCSGGSVSTSTTTKIVLTGATLTAGGSCTVTTTATSTTAGTATNTTGAATSTNGGTGLTASATLTVFSPPTITKIFNPTSIASGGTSTLTLTITNPNAGTGLTSVGITDNLPSGMTETGAATTCPSGVVTSSTATSVAMSGASIAASGSCTVTATVSSSTQGVATNTTNAVTSTNGGTGLTASANLTVIGAAAKLVFTTQPPASTASTATFSTTVSVEDSAGNVVPGSTAAVTLAITAATGTAGATLGGTTTVNAVNGVATFSGLSITTAGTAYTLTATSTGLTNGVSSSFNIVAGAVNKLAFTVQPSSAATGATAFTQQPSISIEDINGNVTASTATVALALTTAGGATLACTGGLTKAATAGVATFAGCNINLVGTYTLTATSSGLTSAISSSITVTAGAASKLVFVQQPSNAVAGAAIAPAITVQVEDAGGNPVSNTASIAMAITTNPGVGTLSGTTPQTAAGGLATFGDLSINKTGTGYVLTASSSGLTSIASNTFNITPGAPTQLVFTTQPGGTITGGTAFGTQPKVSVEDANNNVVTTDSTDQITLAIGTNPSSGTLACTTNPLTVVSGVANFAGCKIDLAGTGYTLTAAATGFTTVTSSAFNVTVGAASKLAFTTQPGGASTGGTPFPTQPVVTVQDAGGNTVTGAVNSITLAIGTNPGGGALNCTTNPKAATAGVDPFAGCAITTAGNGYTLTATATGLTIATSAAFNVSVGPASKLVFTTNPANTVAGATIASFVVKEEDAGSNVVTTASDPITVAIGTNPGGGTLTCTTNPVNAASGVATFSTCSINKSGTSYTLVASFTGLTSATSATFNITAGGASKLAFTTEPSASANASVAFATQPAVTIQDANGNTVSSTATIVLSLTSAGGATLACTGGLSKAATAGIATFAGCNINLAGTYTLTATSGALTAAVSSSITILGPPTVTKSFNPTSISFGGTSTVILTLANPNAGTALTSVNVSDTLPSNMVIANPSNESSTCTSASLAGSSGTPLFTESGASIPASSSCTAQFDVTVTAGGSFNNTSGAVSSTNGGTGTTSNTATLVVQQSPTITSAASTSFVYNAANSFQVTASGSPAPTFSITGGTPPNGVTLSSSGLLSGTPTQAGSFTFTIDATNGLSPDGTQSFTLNVVTQVTYTQPFNASHGWTWTQISCSGGTCTGTPAKSSAADCGPLGTNGVGTLCVEAAQSLVINSAQTMTGYFQNPAYTWVSLGVPANTSVTSVAGGWWDKITTTGSGCTAATGGIQIWDGTNSTEITASDVVPLVSIVGDTAGVTHALGSAVNVISNGASSSSITIRFNLNPSVPTAISAGCDIWGDNLQLAISYTIGGSGGKHKGQVIIGFNRQSDGTMAEAWAYNVDLLSPTAQPVMLSDLKFVRDADRGLVPDPSSITGDQLLVTPINLAKD